MTMSEEDDYTPSGSGGGKESVVVYARFRPQNTKEESVGGHIRVNFLSDETCTCRNDDGSDNTFTFDRIFQPDSEQQDVFDTTTRPILEDMFGGYYATVFAYGQTGSGKTWTMEGDHQQETQKGLIPRSVDYIFQRVAANSKNTEFTLAASYVEIYLEKIRDLLDRTKTKNNLDVRVDLQRGVYVDGATEVVVHSKEELNMLMTQGSNRRHVSATGMNEESSRSHAIFMLTCAQKSKSDGTIKTGKIYMVDLAGSEMVGKTGVQDKRLEEAKHINKSLSALGNVIKALTDPKATFVPYRDSKLTRMLQDSLGGGARAVLIVACSPSSYNMSETVSTLRFGTRAKFIKNKVRLHIGYSGGVGNQEMSGVLAKREEEITRLQTEYSTLEQEILSLRTKNATFTHVYGDVPEVKQEKIATLPRVNMREQVRLHEDLTKKLAEECKAVANEAQTFRPVITDFEKHLMDEKSLFGQLRSDIAKLFKRLQSDKDADNNLAKEKYLEVDRLLAMAKWKAEQMQGKLKPLQRATMQVAAAAAATSKLQQDMVARLAM